MTVQLGQQLWLTRHRLGNRPTPTACRPLWSLRVNPLHLICTDRQTDGGMRKGRREYGIYKAPWFISENVFHIAVHNSWSTCWVVMHKEKFLLTMPKMREMYSAGCCFLPYDQYPWNVCTSLSSFLRSSSGRSAMWSSSWSTDTSWLSDAMPVSLCIRHSTRAARLGRREWNHWYCRSHLWILDLPHRHGFV